MLRCHDCVQTRDALYNHSVGRWLHSTSTARLFLAGEESGGERGERSVLDNGCGSSRRFLRAEV